MGRLKEISKHKARFFGTETRSILDTLLRDIETFCNGAAVRSLSPADLVFRSRQGTSYEEAQEFYNRPATELHAPPQNKMRARRMNAAGIRVFYGSLQEDIAVAELRPPIASYVVVGSFAPTRPLRVLDLGVLGSAFDYADLFDPSFASISPRLSFLSMLEQEVSLPVQPHDEVLDYIPTQVMAEYLNLVVGLDGVAYPSAQFGDAPHPGQVAGRRLPPTERNVALFGAAGITEAEPLSEGVQPGLRLVSRRLLEIRGIKIRFEPEMWTHYDTHHEEEQEG